MKTTAAVQFDLAVNHDGMARSRALFVMGDEAVKVTAWVQSKEESAGADIWL